MDKQEKLVYIFEQARAAGFAKTQKDFAALLDINRAVLSAALNGNDSYLTDNLMRKVEKFYSDNFDDDGSKAQKGTLPVIPTEAMAGTLGEFAESVQAYDCERMISPIKGVDYAIKVCGDSSSRKSLRRSSLSGARYSAWTPRMVRSLRGSIPPMTPKWWSAGASIPAILPSRSMSGTSTDGIGC